MLSVAAVHLVRRCVSVHVNGRMLVPCHSATSASVNWRVRRLSVGQWYVCILQCGEEEEERYNGHVAYGLEFFVDCGFCLLEEKLWD